MVTTSQEAAKQLGMSPALLRVHINRGNVSIRRAGRIVLIDPEQARKELETVGYSWSSHPKKSTRAKRTAQAAS